MKKEGLLVSDYIIKLLRNIGVDRIYGAPGTSELSLMHSAVRFGIKYFFTLHDTTAVGMADGFARASDSIAVANLHATQGLLNAAGLIRVTLRDNIPLLIIVCVPATTYDIYEPNHFTLNLHQSLTPLTKWAWTVSNIDAVGQVFNRAISIALSPPRGPALVCIPQDLVERNTRSGREAFPSITPVTGFLNTAAPQSIERAAKVLVTARKPTIFAGHGAQNAVRLVETAADVLAAPVISESLDRGPQVQHVYCRTNHPLFFSYFDTGEQVLREQLETSDAVLFVGSRATYPKIIGKLPENCTIIELNTNPLELGKYHRTDIPLWGNIPLSLEKLCQCAKKEIEDNGLTKPLADKRNGLVERIERYKRAKNEILAAVNMNESPVTGMHLIRAMKESLPGNAVIVDDSQSMGHYLKHYYDFPEPDTLYGSMASHIGWGFPAALGIKQARMSETVVCLVGDGGFMFGLQALAAASTHRIPVLIIIADNRGFVSLQKEMAVKWELNSEVKQNLSLDKPGFDYVQLSRSMGIEAAKVSKASDLNRSIKHGLDVVVNQGGAFVLDVATTRSLKDWDKSWHVSCQKKTIEN